MSERIEQVTGRRVQMLRERQHLSKIEFCLMTDVSRPYLNRIESGEANITVKQLARLAAALNVEPAALITPDAQDERA